MNIHCFYLFVTCLSTSMYNSHKH